MSICFFTSFLLLVTGIFAAIDRQTIRSYIVKKDLFTPAKAGQFSIFDPTEKQLQYRIESKFTFFQTVELVAQPSKQVVGKLNKKFKLLFYKGVISVLDPDSNRWINGTIHEKFIGHYIIEWNGQRVKMRFPYGSWSTEFIDDKDDTLLAAYDKKLISLVWANKYELKVFSDKLPDAIYFLGLAARDHKIAQDTNNNNG